MIAQVFLYLSAYSATVFLAGIMCGGRYERNRDRETRKPHL